MNRSRILVVDDAPGMLHAVERVLGGTYDIVAHRSSRAALAAATELRPDLAIIDVRMPEIDGFELMAQLKADAPELQIILMTGSIDDLDEKLVRALRSPAFYFIQKPFDREVLRTLVERCLELQWRREEHRRQLQRLETITERFTVPAGACRSWQALYAGACKFADDLMEHIHLENNILFATPREL